MKRLKLEVKRLNATIVNCFGVLSLSIINKGKCPYHANAANILKDGANQSSICGHIII